jgi:hypothetical protein
MNTYRVTWVIDGDSESEWYEAKNERMALVMFGAEISDYALSRITDVRVIIETG